MKKTQVGLAFAAAALLTAGSSFAQSATWEGSSAAAAQEKIASIRVAMTDAFTRIEGAVGPGKTDVLFETSDAGGFSLEVGFDDKVISTLFRCRKGNDDDICDDIQFVFPQLRVDRTKGRVMFGGKAIAKLNEKKGYRIILPRNVRFVSEISGPYGAKTTTVYAQTEAFVPVSYEPVPGPYGTGQKIKYDQIETFSPVSVVKTADGGAAYPRVRVFLEIEPR